MADEGTHAGPDFVETPGEVWVAETQLRPGAVRLTGAVMQNVTHIAPAIAAFFFTQTIVGPLRSACSARISDRVHHRARPGHVPRPAGEEVPVGRRLLHVREPDASARGWGFCTGWMFALYSPIVAGPVLAFLGLIFEGEFQSNYGWTWFHWWMLVIVGLPSSPLIGYSGIALSIETIVVVGRDGVPDRARARACGACSTPARAGSRSSRSPTASTPGDIATATGFSLAIVFTVQGLTGWEAAVPLAEETENPRRNVPRATMALDRHRRPHAGARDLGPGDRLGRRQDLTNLPTVERAAGARDLAPGLGQPVVARPARDVHVGDRRAAWPARTSPPACGTAWAEAASCPSTFGKVASPRARRRPRRSPRSSSCRSCSGSGLRPVARPGRHVHPVPRLHARDLGDLRLHRREPRRRPLLLARGQERVQLDLALRSSRSARALVLIYSLYKSFNPFPAHPYNWSPFICVGMAHRGHRRPPLAHGRAATRAGWRRPGPSSRSAPRPTRGAPSTARSLTVQPMTDDRSAGSRSRGGMIGRPRDAPPTPALILDLPTRPARTSPRWRGAWTRCRRACGRTPRSTRARCSAACSSTPAAIGLTTATVWEASAMIDAGLSRAPDRQPGGRPRQGRRARPARRPRPR